MLGFLAIAFLVCHALAVLLFPHQARLLSYLFLIAAPLLAGLACMRRSRGDSAASGWIALALGMLLWTVGMASNMLMELILVHGTPTPGVSMFCYVLYGVPLTYAMATPAKEAWPVRIIDGLLALSIGYLFFVHTFSYATLNNASDEGVARLRLMFDIENVFIAVFALVRWVATSDGDRRAFFRTLSAFAVAYLLTAGYINHFQADTDYGSTIDLVIDLPFVLLLVLAIRPSRGSDNVDAPRKLSHIVRAGSPLMMPVTLLIVSVLILRTHPTLSMAGMIIAMLGYGVRSVLTQVRTLEEQDQLNELSRMDPLTGIANRRHFDETLIRDWSHARRHAEGMALLLIDIDYFKPLNDGFGHPTGDAYLRGVATALTECVTRGSDLVARYGGEEFAVLLPATTMEGAKMLGEAIRTAVAQRRLPMPPPHEYLSVSVGVGYATPPIGPQPDALIAATDAALYDAKHDGRNRVRCRQL
ncbi:diguanylate cyclase [Dyella sp. ASV21]|uniref:diguanylate cyclase domain-containing protein n=1 Tax=Dyella sp. ASV21 TaxID=2795114 RepID=UPI0018EBBD5A